MSDLIALIRSETDTRRFQKTREDSAPRQSPRGCQVGLAGPTCRPPGPRAHLSASMSSSQFPTASKVASMPFLKSV